jgi:hypothetical protein
MSDALSSAMRMVIEYEALGTLTAATHFQETVTRRATYAPTGCEARNGRCSLRDVIARPARPT